MTISLPESLKQFVEQQVSAGGYASAEEYIGALVEAERARARIEELIVEGLESGPATEIPSRIGRISGARSVNITQRTRPDEPASQA